MGSTSSSVMKKVLAPLSHFNGTNREDSRKALKLASPFVLSRQGSMYFDEDGDLAHEFYIEEIHRGANGKSSMRKVKNSCLRPQKPDSILQHCVTCPQSSPMHRGIPKNTRVVLNVLAVVDGNRDIVEQT